MHAGLGLAGAIVLLEALMLSYDKVPFTCTYLPSENMKALAPIYAIAFIIGAVKFAGMQKTRVAERQRVPRADHPGRDVCDPSRDVVQARAAATSSSTKSRRPSSGSGSLPEKKKGRNLSAPSPQD